MTNRRARAVKRLRTRSKIDHTIRKVGANHPVVRTLQRKRRRA